MDRNTNITISTGTIFKIIGIGFLLYLVYLVWNILLLLFVSIILAALIDPFANWFQKRKIPRGLAVLVIYVVLGGLISFSIFLLAPVITEDLPQLVDNVTVVWEDLQGNDAWQGFVNALQQSQQSLFGGNGAAGSGGAPAAGVDTALSGVFNTITGFFGSVVSLILVLVMTFYLVVQEDPLQKILHSIAPDEYVPYLSQLFKKMRDKLGFWLRAQLILSLVVGLLTFFGLVLLDVKYAAVLALLAALFEFVPYIGPVLAAIPALFLAFTQAGAVKLVFVLVLYIVIQQVENHFLVPKVMQRAVGLNPIVSILAILIGAQLAGILGALIAIPVATALSVFFKDVLATKTN